jgi:hypothetical protein
MSVLLVAAVLASVAAQPQANTCYRFEADSVALAGRVIRRVYPGRPNYESVKAGDEPDTVFVLQLERPLCTRASDLGEARKDVREVQLYFSKDDARMVRVLRGRSVVLRGTLQEGIWGWHHLSVMLHVRIPPVSSGHRTV